MIIRCKINYLFPYFTPPMKFFLGIKRFFLLINSLVQFSIGYGRSSILNSPLISVPSPIFELMSSKPL